MNIVLYYEVLTPFEVIERNQIVKKAIRISEITDRDYIICRYVITTGFNFFMYEDEYGTEQSEYIVVVGSTTTGLETFPEGILSYDFLTAGNHFVLYVTEKNLYFDEFLQEHIVEYTIDGWDVLYPIRHNSIINVAPRYIINDDLR